MSLTLSMLRCPDNVAPETRTVAGGEFSIGRGPENDWVLPDPERGLSKRHCALAYRGGGWQVADLSTNGTFLNREGEPIGRGQARELRDGDRLCFGAYEIEAHIGDEAQALYPPGGSEAAGFGRAANSPEFFALDPFATPSDRTPGRPLAADPLLGHSPGDDPFAVGVGSGAVSLPPDFDPLAPDSAEPDFRGPTQSDHGPHIEDAFNPPQPRTVLPEDWDREIVAAAPAPVTPRPAPPPSAPVPVPPPVPPADYATSSHPTRSPRPVTVQVPRLPEAPPEPAVPRPPLPAAPASASNELLSAFLRGADLADLQPADPIATMERLGAAFRAVVSGLRQAMIARAAVKGEFRIEQTMIRSRGNNPLKFSADDDDALSALVGVGRRSDMGAVEAISDALRDVRLHELATVAAMQAAVRALLAEFEPVRLRQAAERTGLGLVSVQRKAHAWDAFEAQHSRIAQALTDDFDSVFGKAFARAYERALAEISAREPAA